MNRLISISALVLAGALSGCGQTSDAPPAAPATQTVKAEAAEARFDPQTGTYSVSWELSEDAPVTVRVTTSRDGEGGEAIARGLIERKLSWTPAGDEGNRHYFVIEPENGAPLVTSTRLLPLEGGRNFRDLGGYPTEDGRSVKWGRVYRSGVMDGLTDADYDYLSGLGIKVVCDFRESDERDREPTDWRAGAIDYLTFADPEEGDPSDNPMFAALMSPESTPEDVAAGFAASYFPMALSEAEGYARMFDELASGRVPLAFNCSAGKDRAGTAAALVLTALGVPRETVVHDYSLSDDFVDYMAEFVSEEARAEAAADPDNPYGFLMQLPPEKLAPLMASDPRYIEASFAEMEARYGSVMGFIQTELDVTDEELAAMRSTLLE